MLFADIETSPILDVADYVSKGHAPKSYVDPVKIAAKIEADTAKRLADAALHPGLLRIVAIGWVVDNGGPSTWLADDDRAERAMLELFWDVMTQQLTAGDVVVGYRICGFDIPALITRSWLLGVKPAFSEVRKYGMRGVIDLMDRLNFGGATPTEGLSWWCKRFGIAVEDDISGADIPGLVAAGEWDQVAAHVRADVTKTRQLAAKLNLITL